MAAATAHGAASPLLTVLGTPGFITVDPDFKLYRVQGRVDAMSTIPVDALPAPTP